MNKLKKGLLGTTLAGALIIGAGAGTYSWFNAEYKASGAITNHTLTINGDTQSSETLFTDAMLAPSRTVTDSFSIENTGSLDQIIRAKFDLALFDGATNVGSPDKSGYTLNATVSFTRDGNTYGPFTVSDIPAQDLDDLIGNSTWLPDSSGLEIVYFEPGDKLDVTLDVHLLESAGNEYQGKTLKGALEVDARQTDAGSQFND